MFELAHDLLPEPRRVCGQHIAAGVREIGASVTGEPGGVPVQVTPMPVAAVDSATEPRLGSAALRSALRLYMAELAGARDRYARWYTAYKFSDDKGRVNAFQHALMLLAACTLDDFTDPTVPCCDLHKLPICCDPDDCGPCCERCPTCPKLEAAQTPAATS